MAYISNDPNEGIRQVSGQAIPSGGINSFRSPGNEFVNARRRSSDAYFNQRPREPRKPKAKPSSPASTSGETFPQMMARLKAEMEKRLAGPPSPLLLFGGGPQFDGTGDMAQPTPTLSDRYGKPKPTAVPGKPVPVKTNPIATPTVAAPPAPTPAAAPVKPTTPPASTKAPEPAKAPAPVATTTKREPKPHEPDYVNKMGYVGPDGKEVTKTNQELWDEIERKRPQVLLEIENKKKEEAARLAAQEAEKQARQGDPSPERDEALRSEKLREHRQQKIEAELAVRRKQELQEQMDRERIADEKKKSEQQTVADFRKSLEQEAMDKFMAKLRGPQSMTLADRDAQESFRDSMRAEYPFKQALKSQQKKRRASRVDEDEENRRLMQAERIGQLTPLEEKIRMARMAKKAREAEERARMKGLTDEY